MRDHQQEGADQHGRGFPLPFGSRRWLLGHPVPAGELSSPYGRPTSPEAGPRRGFHVSHAPDATGEGALYSPGTVVLFQTDHDHRPAPVASQRPVPAPRHNDPSMRGSLSRAINEGSSNSPFRSSPRRLLPDGTGALGLSPGLRTLRLLAAHAEAGTDHRARTRNLLYSISRTSKLADLLCACDLASHSWIRKCGDVHRGRLGGHRPIGATSDTRGFRVAASVCGCDGSGSQL